MRTRIWNLIMKKIGVDEHGFPEYACRFFPWFVVTMYEEP